MRISEVELVGFKSFVDKTRFVFDERINGVVGPNGCGKSNIVDAIRWVMGELSAKSLRGDCMEDVIFNGTEARKALSMAQVSLIFSLDDGIVPPGFEMYDQIEITRRLYRSGESEYLINKQPARLKDISEILMDTGLGAKAYSIVEQGQISRIISSKPEERRLLIEEAAGITKFRVKKEEALRKIERTKADLDRVQDVVGEIKRQMNSLARQAGKAKRYKEVKEELRQVDLELAARDHKRIVRQEEELGADLTRLTDTKEKGKTAIETGETELAASQLTLAELQAAVEDARRQLSAINEQVRSLENERNILQRDIENEKAKARTFEDERSRAGERIAVLEDAAVKDDDESATLMAQAEEKQHELDELSAALTELRRLLAIKSEDADQVRARQVELVAQHSKLESQVNGWGERREELLVRGDDLAGKKAKNAERLLGLRDRLSAYRINHAELLEEKKEATARLAEKKDRLGTLKEQIAEQRQRFEQARADYQRMQVRLNSLTDMKKNMEGYREGVKNILVAAAHENEAGGSVQGVVGVVADMVKVPQKLEAAFEAVMGEKLQSVVVDDVPSGVKAADFLKAANSGRGSFVPKTPKRETYTAYPATTRNESEGPLSEMVEFDKAAEPVVKHLLDGVLVVNDLDNAVKLYKANGYKGAFVTYEGELVDPHGTITGGSREQLASGILQMKREIEELTVGTDDMKVKFEDANTVYLRSEGLISTQEIAVRDLAKKLDEMALDIREIEAEVKRTESEQGQIEEAQDEIDVQIAQLRELVERGDGEIEAKSSQLTKLREELDLVRKALADSEEGTRELSGKIEAQGGTFTELSTQVSTNRERATAAAARAKTARADVVEAQERIERLSAQIETCGQVATACQEKIEVTVKKIEETIKLAEEKAGLEAQAREKLEAFVQSVREKEDGLKILRRDLDGVSQEIANLNMKAVEMKLRRENLAAQVSDKYGEDLSELLADYGESEVDTEALSARQADLNRALKGLGEVNVSAIEEYDEAKERYEFYEEQQDDLLKSIDNLKQAILKINKESRERFAKAFTAVAAKFSEVLPMLFGGGTAKLSLTESSDILDAGVEVLIRPPGKKLQNMNLMSGGEKALSAIGLIFSIFLIKPSPFCLLDEVDAPLDDANIHRFNELIVQMSTQSQVIVITHNKRTMEVTDQLYGVTMMEKGVSKLVSVKIADIEQKGDDVEIKG